MCVCVRSCTCVCVDWHCRLKMEGHLLKYTNVMKGWQTRWFLMDPESGMLEYFEVIIANITSDLLLLILK